MAPVILDAKLTDVRSVQQTLGILKMLAPKHIPPFLYKYCSAKRAAQIVRDGTLFMAPAAGQNDLYEFRARSLYRATEDSKYIVFAKTLVAEGWFNDINEALEASKELDPTDIEDRFQSAIDALNRTLDDVMNHSGVTCFSSEKNNQRMWGTYGDNHAGAVIEFSTDPEVSRLGACFGPVIYIDKNPGFCPSLFFNDDLSWNQNLISTMLYFKHRDWRDEQEWRVILLANTEQSTSERIVHFERTAITRIFVGPRITQEDKAAMWAAASEQPTRIPVYERVIDPVLAREEPVGFEEIRDTSQLKYWFPNLPK